MNIDDRLEALTMSLELEAREGEAQRIRIDKLAEIVESDHNRIQALTRLIEIDADNIRSLARIAERHELRLDRIDDRA